ncbi:MAG TPA: tetratricopeptide repeat protein, partial [Candidatus Latescibacteria bacterium]|nr:tetratricopeptide repeat protein [Candidatus Latescibacterota bacterium]
MSYEDLIKQAEALLDEDLEAAIELYRMAAQENPNRGEAYYGLGRAYAALGKVKEAQEAFRKAARRMPYDPTAFYNWGAMALKSGELKEAQEALRRAVELKADYPEALYALGRAYEEDGWLVDARLALLKALQARPGWEKAREALSRVESELSQPSALSRYRRVLVVMDQGIGNMVMLTPALRALKELLPEARIAVLGRKPSVEVLEGFGVEALTEPEEDASYDIGFLTIWSADYERAFGGKLRQQCGERLYKVQMDNPDLHESEHHMKIPRLMGYTGPTPEPYCVARDVEVPWGDREKVVALSDTALDHPAWQRKRWPYFRKLAWELVRRGYKVALIGGPSEAARFDLEGWPEVYNLLGRYDISGTAGVLKKCCLFIGNDSGPGHIAGALGIPTFVLFGPTRISKNIPLGPRVRAISKNLPCSPCQYTPRWEACGDWA